MTVDQLHHVGHVVHDIDAAIALYRRMGFVVPPPSFPALADRPGEPLRAFGVGNSHANFRSSFVELVTVADDDQGGVVGSDATLIPLQAPADVLDRLRDGIRQTADRISTALARFQGLHILVFGVAEDLLRAEFPIRRSPQGGCYVPAKAALGAAIIFHSA